MRIAVIGAGLVGLATATELARSLPQAHIRVLEKEKRVGLHQSGRNSGVIHSGIYYPPGSSKALNCRKGRERLLVYCRENSIAYDLCGKVIVAISAEEIPRLDALARRARENGVEIEVLDRKGLARKEPHAAGVAALWVKEAGIVDFPSVMQRLAADLPGEVICDARLLSLVERPGSLQLETTAGAFEVDYLVNCAGLHSDRVCQLQGASPEVQIVPFKGEYYRLRREAETLCRSLIYPVPDPAFPFLGVHLTRMIEGGVEAGPNAVLALGREAYQQGDLNFVDLAQTLTYPGFWKLAGRHWRAGLGEIHRSLSKGAFVKALRRLVPELGESDLLPATCGIRAQALRRDGSLEDDFLIHRQGRCWHVLNAPSPAATSAMAIGHEIAERLTSQLG